MPYPTYRKKSVQSDPSDSVFSYNVSNRSRVSFVPMSVEYVGWFDDNAVAGRISEPYMRYYSNRMLQPVASNLAIAGTVYGSYPQTTFSGKMFDRNYSADYNIGTPRSGTVYVSPVNVPSGVPYDLYVRYEPLSSPQGVPMAFYNTESGEDFDNDRYSGSNCVGIISARNKVYKDGGGVLNITANQRFGEPGTRISTGGGDPVGFILPIGGGTGFFGSNNLVPSTVRYIPIWGSTSDSIDSFGGMSIHAMVWDAWPDCLTVFVPQYFAVMHFNPGTIGSTSSDIDYEGVDFRMPPLNVGTVVNKNTILDPVRNWPVNTSLRGLMVTDDIVYVKKTISFSSTGAEIESKGSGYRINDEITQKNYNVTIKVTSVNSDGGVTGWEFATKQLRDGLSETQDGEDLGDIFPILLGFPSSSSDATCVIKFTQGVVRNKFKLFLGPKQRSNIVKLTLDSDGSKGHVAGTKRTTLQLPSNDDAPEPGEYEVFYLFHNDVGACWKMDQWENVGQPELRYVTLDIS